MDVGDNEFALSAVQYYYNASPRVSPGKGVWPEITRGSDVRYTPVLPVGLRSILAWRKS